MGLCLLCGPCWLVEWLACSLCIFYNHGSRRFHFPEVLFLAKTNIMNIYTTPPVTTITNTEKIFTAKLPQIPLRLFMDQVTKVTFPAFSRMQDEKAHLENSVTRSIFFITFLVFPSVVGLLMVAPFLVRIIPRYEKWIPALIPLALVSVNTIFASVSTQLTNLLNSIGRIKLTFKFMVMWGVLTWLFVPYLSLRYGVNGAALGYALVGSSSLIVIFAVRRIVSFSLWKGVGRALVSALVMALVLMAIRGSLAVNIFSVLVMVVTGGVVYIFMMFVLAGRGLLEDGKKILGAFRG